jgi:hypothetical protein
MDIIVHDVENGYAILMHRYTKTKKIKLIKDKLIFTVSIFVTIIC